MRFVALIIACLSIAKQQIWVCSVSSRRQS
jgi:hypothetical protein